jgi:2-dehydropantoate 2-reductase
MKVLVFGAGPIGSIYSYFLSQAGNKVIHFVRPSRAEQLSRGLHVSILDGRSPKDIKHVDTDYPIRTITDFGTERQFDLILVSVKHHSLEDALRVLRESGVRGDFLFFNGLWTDYSALDKFIPRDRYLWGYPVAGGNVDYEKARLEGAILDNVLLGEIDGRTTDRLKRIVGVFKNAAIAVETPANILHWIWIHMAINAGVISTCLKYGSAPAFMDSTKALREGILTIRETLKVAVAKGADFNECKGEIRNYYLPTFFSSLAFKQVFRRNVLARKIMELHNNLDDLYDLCTDVYQSAKDLGIHTPLFDQKARYFLRKSGSTK